MVHTCGQTKTGMTGLEINMPDTDVDPARAFLEMQMLMGAHGREYTDGEWLQLFDHCSLIREASVHFRFSTCPQLLQASEHAS